jgi:hypothetical protein
MIRKALSVASELYRKIHAFDRELFDGLCSIQVSQIQDRLHLPPRGHPDYIPAKILRK